MSKLIVLKLYQYVQAFCRLLSVWITIGTLRTLITRSRILTIIAIIAGLGLICLSVIVTIASGLSLICLRVNISIASDLSLICLRVDITIIVGLGLICLRVDITIPLRLRSFMPAKFIPNTAISKIVDGTLTA